jgi:hypothetical protein
MMRGSGASTCGPLMLEVLDAIPNAKGTLSKKVWNMAHQENKIKIKTY